MHDSITTQGFDDFLKTLNSDRDKGAEEYLRLRARIERFFEWRDCENIEELADIVFDRITKKIGEGEKVLNAEAYCVTIAKFVLLENRREVLRTEELDETRSKIIEKTGETEGVLDEKRSKCLDSCLNELPDDDGSLIVSYFDTDEETMIPTRKRIAKSLGVTLNSLRIRICRLKSKLESCTKSCCETE